MLEVWRAIERMEGFETVGGWDICLVLGVRGGCFYGADGEWRESGVGLCCC